MTLFFKPKTSIAARLLCLVFALLSFSSPNTFSQVPGPIDLVGTGGTITTAGSVRTHRFNANGTYTPPPGQTQLSNLLVVAGGGGGGSTYGGGGGAGGLRHILSQVISLPSYAVVVGAGGNGGAGITVTNDPTGSGTKGGDSSFGAIVSEGGGFGQGGAQNDAAGDAGGGEGGSGGGGGGITSGSQNPGGIATVGQGNNGGAGNSTTSAANRSGGGGGGSGGGGAAGTNGSGGNGGNGTNLSATFGTGVGVSGVFAGGGGGGKRSSGGTGGTGGTGGGGAGGSPAAPNGTAGVANTGGGGGGSGSNGGIVGQPGGSGIVLVRYTAPDLTITQQPTVNATTTVPFAQQPVIRVRNGADVGVAGITITASLGFGAGSLGGTVTAVTNGSGLATFSNLSISGSGIHRIRFTPAGSTQFVESNNITVSQPSISVTQQPPATATTTMAFVPQPAITLLNAAGSPMSGRNITAAIQTGSGSLGGTVTVVTNGSGVATFTDLAITGSGNHTLRFSVTGFTSTVDSNTINVAPPSISVTQQPSASATTAVVFPQQPVITLLDAVGSPISGRNITAAIQTGSGSLGGTVTVATNGSGVATFSNLAITGYGNHTLRFSAAGFAVTVDSNVINLPLPTITINQQPSASATSAQVFAQQPIIELLDNLASPISGVNITASIFSGSGSIAGTLTVATNGSGLANFLDLSIIGTGNHTIRFTAAGSGVSVDSAAVNVVTPTITITQEPSAFASSSVAFAQQPTIELLDGGAAAISGVNITASIFSGPGSLSGTTVVATNGSGQAVFPNLAITGTGDHVIRFTAAGSGVTVDSTVVSVGTATITIFQEPSSSVPSAGSFPQQPIVELLFNGSPVSGENITASIVSGGGVLGGTVTVATDGSGQATFTNLSLTGSGNHTLRFTAPVFGIQVDSIVINVVMPVLGCPGFDGSSSPVVFVSCTEAKVPGPSITQTITIDIPPGVAEGDLLVAGIAIDESHLVSPLPAGWTLVFQGNAGGGGQAASFNVYQKFATASEPANYSFSDIPAPGATGGAAPAEAAKYGWIMHFTGVSGIIDTAGTINGAQEITAIAPSVTTTSNNNMILMMGGFDDRDIVELHGVDIDPLMATNASYTTITMEDSHNDGAGNNGTSVSGGAAYLIQSSPGASGTENFLDFSEGERWVTVSMALEPLPTQFLISHAGVTNNCAAPVNVTIQATDDSGNPITTYSGTINITTNTGFGDWEVNTGAGTFTQEGVNGSGVGDGTASYQFDPSDNGVVILTFSSPMAGIHNFDIVDADHPSIVEAADPDLNIAFCPTYEFAISNSGATDTCTPATINFRVAQTGGGATLFGYTSTITISNDIVSGFWASGSSNGTLIAGTGDGTASYTFDSADLSVASLSFLSTVADPTINFDVSDGGFTEAGVDNELTVTACNPPALSSGDFVCSDTGSASLNIVSNATNSNRMVILIAGSEGNATPSTAATFNGQPMSLVASALTGPGGFDNMSEIWVMLDAALPPTANSYPVSYSGELPSAGNFCVWEVTDVEQTNPITIGPGTGAGFPVNLTATEAGGASVTTNITTQSADSYVVSSVSTGGEINSTGSSLPSLLTEYDDGGTGFTFIGHTGTISVAGPLGVTESFSATPGPARIAHVAASFSPIATTPTEFRITHNNNGSVCIANQVTVGIYDDYGQLVTGYTGTITISSNSDLGDWSDVSVTNSVVNGTLDDGEADYTFDAADNGEIVLGYTSVSGTVNFDVTDGSLNESVYFDNNLVNGDCAFQISNVGNAYSCSQESITITAVDGSGSLLSSYGGTVTLSTNFNHGTWSIGDGSGVLIDTVAGDGAATYFFAPGDGGDVVLEFHDSFLETVNINVTDGTYMEQGGFDPNIPVLACEFQITHSGTGDTCTAESVTIAIVDGDSNPGDAFNGTINLFTNTNNGTWTLNSGTGTFDDASSDDGMASYIFDSPHSGTVVFDFADIHVETVNFNVTGGGYTVAAGPGLDQDMDITNCGFEISFGGGNTSDVCSLQTMTIQAVDGIGGPVTYTGTVNISTNTTNGTWALNTGLGTFSDPFAEDGAASYTFVTGDGGTAVFDLRHKTPGVVNVDLTDGTLTEDTGIEPLLTVEDCSFRISLSGSTMNACSSTDVTLEVYDRNDVLATDFIGTVDLTTSTNNGNWVFDPGPGILTDLNPNDGIATYDFVLGNGGSATITFTDETTETVSLDVDFNGSSEDSPTFDPDLEVTQCLPTISDVACFAGSPVNIDLPSSAITGGSRMVLLYTDSESLTTTTGASINLAPMTPLMTVSADFTVDNVQQVYAILDADLPAAAGTYSAAFTGGPAGAAMCVVAVEGVKQNYPALDSPASDGQRNSSIAQNTQLASTSITANENNSIILSVAANSQDGTNYTSSLGNSLWTTGTADPTGADWTGNSEFQATAGPVTVTENNDSNGTPYSHTHTAIALAPFISGDPIVNGYVPVTLFQTYSGNLNYRAVGNTLRNLPNTSNANACSFFDAAVDGTTISPPHGPLAAGQVVENVTGTTADLTIPAGSTIEASYLYWAGSGRLADVDDTVTFGPLGSEIEITADGIYRIENPYGYNLEFFAGYKNVTGLIGVTPTVTYSFKDLTVRIDEPGAPLPYDWSDTQGCLGGWGLVVVYDNPLEDLNVINLFDGFQPFRFSSFQLVPRNFRMAVPDGGNQPRGQITHITFEGDDSLNEPGELIELQNSTATLTFTPLTNTVNFAIASGAADDAQYNDTISYPTYDGSLNFSGYAVDSTTSYGTDVDTYYIAGPVEPANPADPSQLEIIYPFGVSGAEQITTRYGSGQDGVFLVGEFISVSNAPIADLEVFINETGPFKTDSLGVGKFSYIVTNNGNGTGATPPAPPVNYADGEVILTINLPTGMTAATITAPDWTCVADLPIPDATAYTCVFDIANDFSTGAIAGQLWATESLPAVEIEVNIDDESSFPLLSNPISQSARISHTADYASCDVVAVGVQPDPTICELAPQFDNVNDLNKNNTDIDDLDEKATNNNNVVQQTTTVAGITTDLRIVKSVVGVLEENQPAQYLLAVTNLGPDVTTKSMTITDTLPDGLVPAPGGATGTGWVCNILGQNVTCVRSTPLGVGATTNVTINTVSVVAPAIEGAFVSNTAAVQAGTYNFDPVNGNNTSTDISQVVGLPVASNNKFLITVNETSTLGGLSNFEDGDLVLYDPVTDTATMFLAESSIPGVTNLNNVNALHLLPNGHILMSSDANGSSINGLSFDAGDVVIYDPLLQTATKIFTGSDVFTGPADIDALHVEYNGSYTPSDWDLIISTTDDSVISAVSYDDNDLIAIDLSPLTPTASLHVDGASGDVFNGDNGDIDALYIEWDPLLGGGTQTYTLSTSDTPTVTIGIDGIQETFSPDDLVEIDLSVPGSPDAGNVFLGDVANGVFSPVSTTRSLNGVHVIEDGYFGHFAIIPMDGDTCTATSITIRKHAGLSHVVDTDYEGTIRISNDILQGTWAKDASANGAIDPLTGNGEALYTFTPADNGEVILFLTQTTATIGINVDVTNGIAVEDDVEDDDFDIDDVTTLATYRDEFSSVGYNNNNGLAGWDGDWVETNDDGSANSGKIRVSGNELVFSNPGGGTPMITRSVDFSGYNAGTVTLTFDWQTTNVSPAENFEVYGIVGGTPTLLTSITGISGINAGTANVVVPLSTAGNIDFRFQISGGYVLESIMLDNIEVATSTTDCGVSNVLDHYAITNNGPGVLCLASEVTISAHSSSEALVTPQAPFNIISLSTQQNTGTWLGVKPGSGTALNFTPSTPGSGMASYEFGPLETSVTLYFINDGQATDTVSVNINASDGMVSDTTGLGHEDFLTVNNVGLRFFNLSKENEDMATLVSGKSSDQPLITAVNDVISIQAIRTTDFDTMQCAPLFEDGSNPVIEFSAECIDPVNCAGEQVSINGIPVGTSNITPLDGDYDAVTVPVTDDIGGFGGAYTGGILDINYPDAGEIRLYARYNIPGTAATNFLTDFTPQFVVRPFGYAIDFDGDRFANGLTTAATSYASDITDPDDGNEGRFNVAGIPFDTQISAVIWEAEDDDGLIDAGLPGAGTPNGGVANDGVPDPGADLTNNTATPNYGNEQGLNDDEVLLTHTQVLPGGGVPGVLNLVTPADLSNFTVGSVSATLTYDEVGIIDITADHANPVVGMAGGYLEGGESITGSAPNVGRFYPAGFTVTLTNLISRPLFGDPTSPFTYMGEDFTAEFTLTAINALSIPTVTQNYNGDFALLDNINELEFFAVEDIPGGADNNFSIIPPVRLIKSSVNPFPTVLTPTLGVTTLSGNLIFNRQPSPTITAYNLGARQEEAPITQLQIAITAVDDDGVLDLARNVDSDDGSMEDTNFIYNLIGIQEFRYGRIRMENAYGSEIPEEAEAGSTLVVDGEDLPIQIFAEYFDGTEWVVNLDDSVTPFNSNDLAPVPGSFTDNLSTSTLTINIVAPGTIYQGETNDEAGDDSDKPIYLTAPGEGNDGTAVLELDLSALGLDFLKYEWRGAGEIEDENEDSSSNDNPRALIEFGTFQINQRIINWQELFLE